MARSVVVFPTELGPNNTKKRPSATLNDRFARARADPNDLVTFAKLSAQFATCSILLPYRGRNMPPARRSMTGGPSLSGWRQHHRLAPPSIMRRPAEDADGSVRC